MLKGLKIIGGLAVMVTLLLSISTGAEAHGRRYSGMDHPEWIYKMTSELQVNGHLLNVEVATPKINTCSVSDVFVTIDVPQGTDVSLTSEGSGTFDCGDGTSVTLRTQTSINYAKVKGVVASAMVVAPGTFDMSVSVYKNGVLEQSALGSTNETVKTRSVSFDADGGSTDDGSTDDGSTDGGSKGGGGKKGGPKK